MLAFACNFISRSLHAAGHNKATHTSRHQAIAIRVLSALVLLLLVGAWVATSLAGAKMQLANAFNLFVFVGLIAILAISSSVFGWEKVRFASGASWRARCTAASQCSDL